VFLSCSDVSKNEKKNMNSQKQTLMGLRLTTSRGRYQKETKVFPFFQKETYHTHFQAIYPKHN